MKKKKKKASKRRGQRIYGGFWDWSLFLTRRRPTLSFSPVSWALALAFPAPSLSFALTRAFQLLGALSGSAPEGNSPPPVVRLGRQPEASLSHVGSICTRTIPPFSRRDAKISASLVVPWPYIPTWIQDGDELIIITIRTWRRPEEAEALTCTIRVHVLIPCMSKSTHGVNRVLVSLKRLGFVNWIIFPLNLLLHSFEMIEEKRLNRFRRVYGMVLRLYHKDCSWKHYQRNKIPLHEAFVAIDVLVL